MNEKVTKEKTPISKRKIFKIMLWITYIVAGVFLLKNIIGGDVSGMIAIGLCLVIYTVILVGMKMLKRDIKQQQFVASIGLVFVVFVISLYSGDYYSDDFGLYMAILGLTGMYLRPKYTVTQIVLMDVMLVLQYILHPEKADPLGQYIMCMVIFTLGGFLLYLVISRGRAFIDMGYERAEEAERLLASMKEMGESLQKNFENSTEGIAGLKGATERLGRNADELRQSSVSISQGAHEVSDICDNAQDKMEATEKQVVALTNEVHGFETSLEANRKNMEEMSQQMVSVQTTMDQANEVFRLLEGQMQEISAVTEQLNSISSSTTMLALNASIEAARAGQSGAGFAVVASKVQDLAVDSNKCSDQVASVVGQMQRQIQETTKQLAESGQAIHASLGTLEELQNGFEQLTKQFGSLYQNIEVQNENINEVTSVFEQLKDDIAEMSQHSEENEGTVDDIAETMEGYKKNVEQMIVDTQQIYEMSANLLSFTQK